MIVEIIIKVALKLGSTIPITIEKIFKMLDKNRILLYLLSL